MLTIPIWEAFEAGVSRASLVEGVQTVAQGAPGEGFNKGAARLLKTSATTFLAQKELAEEVFGPSSLAVVASSREEMMEVARSMEGHLTATLHGTEADLEAYADLIDVLERKVGRLIVNGFPTGVEVCHAMVHGGPYPATTAPASTSVGTGAIRRFTRPICYQDFPAARLPETLRDENPLGILRLVDGAYKRDAV